MKKQNSEILDLEIGNSNKQKKPFLHRFSKKLNKEKPIWPFVLFLTILSLAWCIYTLVFNHFSIMFGWDYCSQYITFYYDYWDIWRTFFSTGKFTLVDFSIYMGVDNIGSNSYYGLFDPFVIALTLFPRHLIPQTFTVMTMLKIICSALFMRLYLKYLGIKEGTARFGATAYAFSGYMNFMLGFCSFVSVLVYVPLLLLGIEKVEKERKPTILILSIFLIGITSFFFLVVLCIWGVLYAIWRYFQTIGTRTVKENFLVIGFGVASFALGIMFCSFTLIPSLRQSMLAGRTESIGSLYLKALIESFSKGGTLKLLTEQVGGSPAREIMPLVSFFFPTGGYLYLPTMIPAASYKYDAWVASIFCYTPFIILFFLALLTSIRKKKISHFIALAICSFLLFTNFAYFAFFAFTGNGYGRWFLVLIPCIIYYGCWGFDNMEESPVCFPVLSGIFAMIATIGTYFLMRYVLKGKTFENPNGFTYFITSEYLLPGEYSSSYNGYSYSTIFTLLYEVLFVILEGSALITFNRKPYIRDILLGLMSVEIVIMGNMNFVFCGYWNIKTTYNGGENNFSDSLTLSNYINQQDSGLFRSYFDTTHKEKNFASSIRANSSSAFHSLLNFECYDYSIISKMASPSNVGESYGGKWSNPSWSAQYVQKRFATDVKQGYKYYVIKNGGYPGFEGENVPFNSELIYTYKNPSTGQIYRVFKNNDAIELGYAVESDQLYYMKSENENHSLSYFYNNTFEKVLMSEELMLSGAIVNDDMSIDGFTIADPTDLNFSGKTIKQNTGFKIKYYETSSKDLFLAEKNSPYRDEGPAYFIKHYTPVNKSNSFSYKRDVGKVVLYPSSGFGNYFNDDPRGCYFDLLCSISKGSEPRIYMIGDTFDNSGNILKKDTLLNFEWNAIVNADVSGKRLNGFYAKGRVKYICFCAPSGGGDIMFNIPTLYMREYGEISSYLTRIHENELKNVVKTGPNTITSTSNYSEEKVVVTHIAYDDSWKLYANGEKIDSFKLDGGFLGFVAPAGEVSYLFKFKTEGLSIGLYLFIGATGVYGSYLTYEIVKTLRKKKEGFSSALESQN